MLPLWQGLEVSHPSSSTDRFNDNGFGGHWPEQPLKIGYGNRNARALRITYQLSKEKIADHIAETGR